MKRTAYRLTAALFYLGDRIERAHSWASWDWSPPYTPRRNFARLRVLWARACINAGQRIQGAALKIMRRTGQVVA